MKSRHILLSAIIVVAECLYNVNGDCSLIDETLRDWKTGRKGELLVAASNQARVEILLSRNVSGFNPHCLEPVSHTGIRYVFKVRNWCPYKGDKRKIRYIMDYINRAKPIVNRVKVQDTIVCAVSLVPSYATTLADEKKTCSNWITKDKEGTAYEVGTISLYVKSNMTGWTVKVGFQDPFTGFNIIEGQLFDSTNCMMVYSNYDHNKYLTAGSTLTLKYHLNYNQNQLTPKISWIEFGNTAVTATCGTKTTCSSSTTTTTTTPTKTTTTTSTSAAASTRIFLPGSGGGACISYLTSSTWTGGESGNIAFQIPESVQSWTILIGFNFAPTDMYISQAEKMTGGSRCSYEFKNWNYNNVQAAGSTLSLDYGFHYQWDTPNVPKIKYVLFSSSHNICGEPQSCGGLVPITTISTAASSTLSTATKTTTTTKKLTSDFTTSSTTSSSSATPTSQSTSTTTTSKKTSTSSSTASSATTTKPICVPKYDYKDAIHKSLLFYEAQKSGPLPATNRIKWRRSSTMNDGNLVGEDLTGGYFDAGDYVKFTFPAASAVTVLAWGMIEFSDGYKFAGEYENGLDAIKWATDYFIKCHTEKYTFWAQVGEGHVDHTSWGRASDLDESKRYCHSLTASNAGSDLLGEVAASLAASSIVFKDVSRFPNYSKKLLDHAKELYEFAKTYQKRYSDSISDAKDFYQSYSGFFDELAWAASWLYYATDDIIYLNDAEGFWNSGGMSQSPNEFSWDNKGRGVAVLLAALTGKSVYVENAKFFCETLQGPGTAKTPQGMVFIQQWGANRHAANVAFVCIALSKYVPAVDFTSFSRKQIHLLLGDAGRSYVVGFGNNPPLRPHHSGASCPNRPAPCNFANLHTSDSNPQVLYGALVGGPDQNGNYEDRRNDFIKNEVALDYNAGFQSSLAALLVKQKNGRC